MFRTRSRVSHSFLDFSERADLCERLSLRRQAQKNSVQNYRMVGLRAIENLRIVELVCELCDKGFRLFGILEYKRRIEVFSK
jgi:hypothetical protein